jgi:hypothetical protein
MAAGVGMICHMLFPRSTTMAALLATIAMSVSFASPANAAESAPSGERRTVTTELGDIQADTMLVEGDHLVPAAAELLQHLTQVEPADRAGLELMVGPFGTIMARSDQCLVTQLGVLKEDEHPPVTADDPIALPENLPTALRRTVSEMIAIADGDSEAANPYERAAFERILAHHGLTPLVDEFPETRQTLDALARRFQPHAVAGWRNDREHITVRSVDDTDPSRWIWTSTTDERVMVSQPAQVSNRFRLIADTCRLVCTWSSDDHSLRSAELYQQGQRVLSWDGSGPLAVDADAWEDLCAQANSSNIPPHLVILNQDGSAVALVTTHGAISIPQEAQGTDHFLDQAAEMLKTPDELDLLGTAIFDYVSDSPDSTRPWLIGNEHHHGDEHQTAYDSIARAAGGIIHGDCDDLAELFHQVLSRQHRNPIMLSLPSHAATAWATQTETGWSIDVLHTGRPVHVEKKDVPSAISEVISHFSDGTPADPNQVSLLLRFADENRRTNWRLGWRIFSEPEYAQTMIDIQRCWHFRVYGTAITLTKGLLDGGDLDLANFSELAGLYRRTSQWDLAIDIMSDAIERIDQPEVALLRRMEFLWLLIRAHRFTEADTLALELGDAIVAQWDERQVVSLRDSMRVIKPAPLLH